MKILVTETLAEEGLELLRNEAEVEVQTGLDHASLGKTIVDFDAVVVRSATKLTADILDKTRRLKVIGRAGVGVDNVDLVAATRRGITVVNAPQSNTLAAAEHTVGLLLALVRNIPAADSSLRRGEWDRERFTGVELHGKVLGIIGLGRIGVLVGQRASAFGMKILATDPFVSKARAGQLGIEMVPLERLCTESDFISVHVPKTADNEGLIGDQEFGWMRPDVRIINASRGGIVDERALVSALEEGRIAGAAVDVFDTEPARKHPLFELPSVVVTPHLGALTEEAQTKAGSAIAEQVLLALKGEFAPYAVNMEAGGEFAEVLRPFLPLAEKLGRVLAGLTGEGVSSLSLSYQGTLAEHETRVLTLGGLKGFFSTTVNEPVTFVNAPLIAKERGIEVSETKSARSEDFVDLVELVAGSDEGSVTVAGTLVGKKHQERIVRVYDYEIDMEPARFMCFMRYEDRPGIVGNVGSVLGEAGVNIAGMHVSRETIGGEALMGLTVDSSIPADVTAKIAEKIKARDAKFIDLGD